MVFGVGIFYIARNAEQKGGMAGWRLINFFLGGVTVGMGFIFLVFGGTPDEVWWLSKREKRMAKARILSNATGGGEKHPWRWSQAKECLRDPQWYCAVAFNFLGNVPNGALTTYVLPQRFSNPSFQNLIYRSFGFDPLETVLYSLPMYAVSFCCVVISAITVRYYPRMRFPIALIVQAICVFVLLFAGVSHAGKWAKWGVWTFSLVYAIVSAECALTTGLVYPRVAHDLYQRRGADEKVVLWRGECDVVSNPSRASSRTVSGTLSARRCSCPATRQSTSEA